MIPEIYINEWRVKAAWQSPGQVEQDLVISRALVCLYSDPQISNALVFRGGTALNKLFIKPPARYSEDIDFVQKNSEPIGPTINKIRDVLIAWLGEPKWKMTERSVKLIYSYEAIGGLPTKLKLEINTTEHFQVLPLRNEHFAVESDWFAGRCQVVTYELAELMATKLRALYQRRKGRDLFDLWHVLKNNLVDMDLVIDIFQKYCAKDNIQVSGKLFQKNMALKKLNKDFQIDMNVLLPLAVEWNFEEAFNFVQNNIISKLKQT